ncbi:MAG: hypothetical protein KZQ95_02770 [Candidatus Thiodiazotropha sp. (ex Epidulcina cf. delphinae)]|nr:hypothetical protein [Candidatus Thiodiazotropha sp. (ex Epidulcina cf. delphinae)]
MGALIPLLFVLVLLAWGAIGGFVATIRAFSKREVKIFRDITIYGYKAQILGVLFGLFSAACTALFLLLVSRLVQ